MVMPRLGRQRQKDQKTKVILIDIASLRPGIYKVLLSTTTKINFFKKPISVKEINEINR